MVMPGDNVSVTVQLLQPIAMKEGLRFAIREGGRTVGAGVVTKIIEYGSMRAEQVPSRVARWMRPRSEPQPDLSFGFTIYQYEVGLRSMRAEQKRKGYSSTGRASVSKTEGWGFDSLCPCPRAFFSGLLGVASRSLFWRSH